MIYGLGHQTNLLTKINKLLIKNSCPRHASHTSNGGAYPWASHNYQQGANNIISFQEGAKLQFCMLQWSKQEHFACFNPVFLCFCISAFVVFAVFAVLAVFAVFVVCAVLLSATRIEPGAARLRGERAIHYATSPQNKKCQKVDSSGNQPRAVCLRGQRAIHYTASPHGRTTH